MSEVTITDLLTRIEQAASGSRELDAWRRCRIGSCQRHQDCMYHPCRAAALRAKEANRG